MAREGAARVLRHSVLDRLAPPDGMSTGVRDLRIGVEDLRQAIRRDLEWLLNTRVLADDRFEAFEEVGRSILTFGLPDLNPYSRSSGSDRSSLCRAIEDAIRRFEPRLDPRTVKVEFVPNDAIDDFAVHFVIAGMIRVDPIREAISFDTSMDPNSGTIELEEIDDA